MEELEKPCVVGQLHQRAHRVVAEGGVGLGAGLTERVAIDPPSTKGQITSAAVSA